MGGWDESRRGGEGVAAARGRIRDKFRMREMEMAHQ